MFLLPFWSAVVHPGEEMGDLVREMRAEAIRGKKGLSRRAREGVKPADPEGGRKETGRG